MENEDRIRARLKELGVKEAELEKVLEKFDDEQLEAIFTAIGAAEALSETSKVKKKTRTKSSSIH